MVLDYQYLCRTKSQQFSAASVLLKSRLAFALAFVHGFRPRRRISQGLGGSFFGQHFLGIFLFLAKVHDGSAECKTDGSADSQKNDVRGFHKIDARCCKFSSQKKLLQIV